MSTSRAMEDLARAAAAAGFAMASIEDDAAISPSSRLGDEVARGERIPTASSMLSVLPAPQARPAKADGKSFAAGAQQVREAVFGYLGLGATA